MQSVDLWKQKNCLEQSYPESEEDNDDHDELSDRRTSEYSGTDNDEHNKDEIEVVQDFSFIENVDCVLCSIKLL